MTLNENSFSAKLYKWFHGELYLPNEFCPYGRKLIIAYLLVIPYSIFCLPFLICELFERNYRLGETETNERIAGSFFFYIFILLISAMVCTIFWIFGDYQKGTTVESLGSAGLIVWIVLIGVFICYVVSTLYKLIRNKISSSSVVKTDNVVFGLIKVNKEKICPKITWVKK